MSPAAQALLATRTPAALQATVTQLQERIRQLHSWRHIGEIDFWGDANSKHRRVLTLAKPKNTKLTAPHHGAMKPIG